ncbi:MAG: anthranilate phosphoribosyltransferase family protein [Coleofasciculaceae cyanobacterium SM2_1_6]|nr:anthranilate phosphoribosyltransferase family protein [Coleofasciculaceae cyanobacterium SM2_1_6]
MSKVFREFLKKIGSGPHTGQNLDREEAAIAARMMLLGEATPAQIGAFLIAHRIKRPTGAELAGMLDAYAELGPKLEPIKRSSHKVFVLGSPYDGRSRTAPLSPLTALILATAGIDVILHGGDRMPTKEGLPLIEVWQYLDVSWQHLSLVQVQQVLETTGIGFVYLPTHFPQAQHLVTYRREIGKRPPLATLELMWCPYQGSAEVVSGFVHPPTEIVMREAYNLRGSQALTTVKGLEGSCDLPRERTAIIGLSSPRQDFFERLCLHSKDYNSGGKNVELQELDAQAMQAVLAGESFSKGEAMPTELMLSTLWNTGFYLWRSGITPDISTGMAKAESLLREKLVLAKLQELQTVVKNI